MQAASAADANSHRDGVTVNNATTNGLSYEEILQQVAELRATVANLNITIHDLKNGQKGEEDDRSSTATASTVDGTAIVTNGDKLFTLKNAIRKEIENYGGGDIFDPKVKFSKWKHDIQDFIKVNEDYIPNETAKIHLIASRLKDTARDWFEEHEATFKDYKDLLTRLEDHFKPLDCEWNFLFKLDAYNARGKSVDQIAAEFAELAKSAPKGIPKVLLAWEFFRKVPYRTRQAALIQHPPFDSTWQNLRDLTKRLDATSTFNGRVNNTLEGRIGEITQEKKKKKIRCLRCHQLGHFGDRCPTYPNKKFKVKAESKN